MLSSLLPWKMLVQRAFIFPRNYSSSLLSVCMFSEGPLSIFFSLYNSCTRLLIALLFSFSVSFIFLSIFSNFVSSMFLYIQIIKILIKMYQSLYGSTKHKSIFQSPNKRYKLEPKRMESFRKSVRKPIFDESFNYSITKPKLLARPNSTTDQIYDHIQFQQSVLDDFCGCEHNLVPCAIIKDLLVGLNEADMRQQYERLERANGNRPKYELRRKYFRYLPSYYPEIYHAQLANILSNIDEELSINEFLTLAWIEYHAKYEHIAYFLFSDLKNAKKPKKKFLDNLEVSLIAYEVNFNALIQESKVNRLPLTGFLENFYQTFGANIIPLSQYGKFIKILLRNGYKSLTSLLILLLTKKKQTLFDLLQYYTSGNTFLQKSRALLWQQFFEQLSKKKEK